LIKINDGHGKPSQHAFMLDLMPLFWLALGAALSLFNGGKWAIPLAAWLAPVFLLHFARLQSPLAGLLWLWLVLFAAIYWSWRGMIPAPGISGVLISGLIALANVLPFMADRLIAPYLPGFAATLVFPLAWAVLDFAAARLNPYGTWGSLAYTQHGNLPLMQLASVTGTPGIAFLVAWFASVADGAWTQHFEWAAMQRSVLVYALVWFAVMLLGGLRLVLSPTPNKSVRVAAIGWPEEIVAQAELMSALVPRALTPDLPSAERDQLSETFERVNGYFFEASRREARAGAKIIVWPETNASVFSEDEAALVQRARQMAREEDVYLLMGMAVVHSGSDQPFFENKATLIDPAGTTALNYTKAIPVPGFEARMSRRGKPQLLIANTPHGRLAVAICYDMDFPHFILQAGAAGADLLLVPASDWEAIKLAHHISAVFRAVENGVPLLRATRWGLSAVVDPYGRTLAQLDPFIAPSQAMVAHLPLCALRTIYARFSDWFAWLCVAALSALSAWRVLFADTI
jgi:apolipoprotein N-acyltransferase